MLASTPIIPEPSCLLADVRQALSAHPELVEYPARLAALLGTDEPDIVLVLEALTVEGEVRA